MRETHTSLDRPLVPVIADSDEPGLVGRFDIGAAIRKGDTGFVAVFQAWRSNREYLAELGENVRCAPLERFWSNQLLDPCHELLAAPTGGDASTVQ